MYPTILLRCRLLPRPVALTLGWSAVPIGWAAAAVETAPAAGTRAVVDYSISRRFGGKSRVPAAPTSMIIINLLIGRACEDLRSHGQPDATRYSRQRGASRGVPESSLRAARRSLAPYRRSEEHTSELQSRENLVC